ncbi:glycosyltransferase family 2 protein [Paraburkholderia acidisoli]|uniref:Glycosyltransferase n=1 Tax=Paraburkholderia acidisoli TaxID=2571748 RepID=A0A7Z2GNW5_9BURK|nr:glycosyltransferase family A protein [Paraburkholderia acidisoli]QGZ65036.1 glycosyltransferase [Paraburkholderia acidisoli]
MTTTTVSLCVPTCDRPDLLVRCIDSCLAQTHTGIEIVIGDDSGDERTAQVIAERNGNDARIDYRRNLPALGQARNVASLFERARGDKILLIHDDDFLLADAIARLLAPWQRHPDLEVAFGDQYETGHDGRIDYAASRRMNHAYHRTPAAAGLQALPGRVGIVQMFPNNGWLANADLVRRIGYDAQYGTCCDYVFGTRLCLAARRVFYVNAHVSCYRITDVSVSQATRHTMNASSIAAWQFLERLALPRELEAARKLAMKRLVPIVVSLHARNHEARAGFALALGNLYAYRFGLSVRLYYHLLMIWKASRNQRAETILLRGVPDEPPAVDTTRARMP